MCGPTKVAATRNVPKDMKLLLATLILAVHFIAEGQPPSTGMRWFHVGTDSVLVEYAKANARTPRPAIIVLSDRFGAQSAISSMLAIFAEQGFHAYAIPLRSAHQQAVAGIPQAEIDSLDFSFVAEIAAEINGDPDCSNRLGLLGFDVGASVGAIVAARLPLFSAGVLFYPAFPRRMALALPEIEAPLLLDIAEFDPDFTMADMNAIKESCIEKGRRVKAVFYKEAKRFFFNPRHEHSHKQNTQTAWNEMLAFFRNRLR
jgi:dienelactone hydrolase